MREEGFYWVKEANCNCIIAEYVCNGTDGYFRLPCDIHNIITDNELQEIDEKRIIR